MAPGGQAGLGRESTQTEIHFVHWLVGFKNTFGKSNFDFSLYLRLPVVLKGFI